MNHHKYLALLISTLFFVSSIHAQEWVLQNPFNKLGDINDVKIHPNGKGYAVGDEAILLVTDNFGEVWEGKKSASTGVIWTVHIVKNTDAQVALAGGFRLERTDDGGDTWERVGGSLVNISGIHSLDESLVYISTLGDGILKSTDGGINWTPTDAPDNIGYDDLYFKDEQNGWVLASPNEGDQIWKTADGGDTWEAFDSTYQSLNRIEFASDQIGYASSTDGVIKSSDGGLTWDLIQDSPTLINDISVLDENIVWITRGFAFQFTMDGGQTWSPSSSPSGIGGNLESIFMLDENNVWLTTRYVTIGYSSDMGATWEDQIRASKADIASIKFADDQLGYAAGSSRGDDALLKTTNAGAVWETIKIGEDLSIRDMDILGSSNVVIGTIEGAYISFDGGISVNPLPNFDNWIESVDYVDNEHIFLGTGAGEIFKTDSNGNNIKGITSSTMDITSISMVNKTRGWATTLDKHILFTNDGGQNWNTQFTGMDEMIACLALSEDKALVAPDFGNYILMTEDGGQNWNQISVPNGTFWGGFTFMDQDTGWLAGGSSGVGWIFKTRDGGFNWELDIRTRARLHDVVSPVEGRQLIWAAGVGGQILRFSECNAEISLSNLQAPAIICEGVSNIVSVDFEGVDIFEWTIPDGWEVIGSNTSAQISLVPGNTGGEITVAGFNSCGDGTDTLKTNLLGPTPNPAPVITEDNMVLTSETTGAAYQWYQDGILIDGATENTFTPSVTGDYYVVVEYANGCASPPSNTINVISSSIIELGGETLTLYPNPAYSQFTLEGEVVLDEIVLYDYTGKMLKRFDAEKKLFSLSGVPSGLYLIKILKGKEAKVLRMIVQK